MKTTVVNIRNSEYDVYIGRAGHGQDGYFGNPIRFGQKCPVCGKVHANTPTGRREVLICYEKWFFERIGRDAEFARRVQELKGKRLACFCKPLSCHGDILVRYLEDN